MYLKIEERLRKWERSQAVGGSYDFLQDRYTKIPLPGELEPIAVEMPTEADALKELNLSRQNPSNVPHPKNQEELDKEFLEQFELDPQKKMSLFNIALMFILLGFLFLCRVHD